MERHEFSELKKAYNDRPDESSAAFDDKLRGQLADVSSAGRQLFAELYLIELSVLGNIRPDTKFRKVDAVLSLCEPPLSLANPGDQQQISRIATIVNQGGVLSGGMGFSNQRWIHLQYLVEFGMAWTKLDAPTREQLLSTPQGIEQAVFNLADMQNRPMESALAFLLAPGSFPPIVSNRHIKKIADHFTHEFPDVAEIENSQRRVGEIQSRLKAERGRDWHFYVDPDEWNPKIDRTAPLAEPTPRQIARGPVADNDDSEDDEHALPPFPGSAADSLLVDAAWLDTVHSLLAHRKQIVLEGPPGTGKTFLARRMAKILAGSSARVKLVQFHPAYTYEDFFEGFRPTASGALELRDGPLKTLAAQAAADEEGNPHFLIIDEMNRGNLAKIFGELYFLLEYRDESVELMYSHDEFSLPSNLYIIASMNSADRSIASVDAAMRRRFAFVPLTPDTTPTASLLSAWCTRENVPHEIARLWEVLNERIAERDPGAVLGPSYFMRAGIADRVVLERIWEYEVLPQLRDSFYGDDTVSQDFQLEHLLKFVDAAALLGA